MLITAWSIIAWNIEVSCLRSSEFLRKEVCRWCSIKATYVKEERTWNYRFWFADFNLQFQTSYLLFTITSHAHFLLIRRFLTVIIMIKMFILPENIIKESDHSSCNANRLHFNKLVTADLSCYHIRRFISQVTISTSFTNQSLGYQYCEFSTYIFSKWALLWATKSKS